MAALDTYRYVPAIADEVEAKQAFVGRRFGSLTVEKLAATDWPWRFWWVRCACGARMVMGEGALVKGLSKNCGWCKFNLAQQAAQRRDNG